MLEFLFTEDTSGFVTSERAAQLLRDQKIDEDGPGTLLKDFETILHFIGTDGLKTTSRYFLLPQSTLTELNLRMSQPVRHQLKRPQQRSFPHLHGLHLILRASAMSVGQGAPPNGRLVLDQETIMSWRELNATERYFALLESWLVYGVPEIVGEPGGWSSSCMVSLVRVASSLRDRQTAGDSQHGGPLYNTMALTTAALMELFGWVRLEFDEPEPGKGVQVAAVERLDFGDAMVNVLHNGFLNHDWTTDLDEVPPAPGTLRPVFQPYFPEYQRVIEPRELPYLDGTLLFRVTLQSAWRRIAAPDDSSLDDLATTIIDAFDFEMDHLYCFELRQPNGRKLRIACPYEEDSPALTDDFALGELPISEGDTMTMIFDYGDWWEFDIKLEEVRPAAKAERPHVVAKRGKPPAQYSWDDDME